MASTPWTRRIQKICERSAALIPQTTAASIFTITGGKILVRGIYGEVVVAIGAVANATKIKFTGTNPVATTDLCATLDINAKASGSVFTIVGVVATAMKSTTNNLVVPADNIAAPGLVLGSGAIKVDCAGSSVTGTVKWTLVYDIIDSGANVAAA